MSRSEHVDRKDKLRGGSVGGGATCGVCLVSVRSRRVRDARVCRFGSRCRSLFFGECSFFVQKLLPTYRPFCHAPGEPPAATTCTPGTLQGLAGPGIFFPLSVRD